MTSRRASDPPSDSSTVLSIHSPPRPLGNDVDSDVLTGRAAGQYSDPVLEDELDDASILAHGVALVGLQFFADTPRGIRNEQVAQLAQQVPEDAVATFALALAGSRLKKGDFRPYARFFDGDLTALRGASVAARDAAYSAVDLLSRLAPFPLMYLGTPSDVLIAQVLKWVPRTPGREKMERQIAWGLIKWSPLSAAMSIGLGLILLFLFDFFPDALALLSLPGAAAVMWWGYNASLPADSARHVACNMSGRLWAGSTVLALASFGPAWLLLRSPDLASLAHPRGLVATGLNLLEWVWLAITVLVATAVSAIVIRAARLGRRIDFRLRWLKEPAEVSS